MTKMTRFSGVLAVAAFAAAASAQTAAGGKPCMHMDGAASQALDWRQVASGPEPVIYIGDVHSAPAIKAALAGAMLDFARAGAGTLAVEMLHASDQPLLDRYGSDPDARRELGRRLGTYWMAPAEDYLKLFDAAHAAGLNLYALQPDAAAGEAGDADGPTGPAAPSARNAAMAARLAALARRPGVGRVIVFIGADHARKSAMPAQLRQDGAASRSYAFASPDDPAELNLKTAGLEDGRWLLPGNADFDGLISIPSVLRDLSR